MGQARLPAETLDLGARCYRLTASGRACVEIVESDQQTLGSLSRYLHDVLMLCGSGMWFEQLRQFMPPRSLEQSLHSLLVLGLIEAVENEGGRHNPSASHARARPVTAFGALAAA